RARGGPMSTPKLFAAAMLFAAATMYAAAQQPSDRAVGPSLPPNLRALLIEEMLAVLAASESILDALVRGEDERVAQNAQAIHDSFILEQRMTDADREALHAAVPHA